MLYHCVTESIQAIKRSQLVVDARRLVENVLVDIHIDISKVSRL